MSRSWLLQVLRVGERAVLFCRSEGSLSQHIKLKHKNYLLADSIKQRIATPSAPQQEPAQKAGVEIEDEDMVEDEDSPISSSSPLPVPN